MNTVLQLILLLDHYEYGRERGWSEHKRVEAWGTGHGKAQRKQNEDNQGIE